MANSEAQIRADKAYKERNKNNPEFKARQRYQTSKSHAFRFVKAVGNKDDLVELEELIKKRISEL